MPRSTGRPHRIANFTLDREKLRKNGPPGALATLNSHLTTFNHPLPQIAIFEVGSVNLYLFDRLLYICARSSQHSPTPTGFAQLVGDGESVSGDTT